MTPPSSRQPPGFRPSVRKKECEFLASPNPVVHGDVLSGLQSAIQATKTVSESKPSCSRGRPFWLAERDPGNEKGQRVQTQLFTGTSFQSWGAQNTRSRVRQATKTRFRTSAASVRGGLCIGSDEKGGQGNQTQPAHMCAAFKALPCELHPIRSISKRPTRIEAVGGQKCR
jgi:hypothetical protein